MPSTENSMMMTISTVASQSKFGDIKLEYWLKRLNRSSSSAALCNGSALSMWLSCVKVMVSMTSFTEISCDLGISEGTFLLLLQSVFFIHFTEKAFYHIGS